MCALLACVDVQVTFHGLQAHAAADPWMGKNALDALLLLFQGVALWRQQIRPTARVHGIVVEGGTAANIIPDRTVARFMVRSDQQDDFERMQRRFEQIAQGAAMAADCTVEIVQSALYTTMKDNSVLRDLFRANMVAHGVPEDPFDFTRLGSSDMGNVSLVVPTIHPYLAICDEGDGGPLHRVPRRRRHTTSRRNDLDGGHTGGGDRLRLVHGPAARRCRLAGVPRRLMEAHATTAGAELARYYDLDLADETDDVDFYLALTVAAASTYSSSAVAPAGWPIPIAQTGNGVVGVDNDAAMLARARTAWAATSGPVGRLARAGRGRPADLPRSIAASTW